MRFTDLLFLIREDLRNHGGNAFLGSVLTYFFNCSFRLILNYRIGNFLAQRRNPVFSLIILFYKRRQILKRSCDISYNCSIGRNIRFPHPVGIVIGEHVKIENNVSIWQQVTLGSHGKHKRFAYPVICDGVKIFAGAKIIGGLQVGEGSIIGANAVVIDNVDAGMTVVGIPGRSKNGQ